MIYKCNDGNCEVEIEAESAEEAAQEYVDGGDWGDGRETSWVTVYVTDEDGDCVRIKIAVEPDEPDCDEEEHEWKSPYELVGGLKENPGVFGSGGGVKITEVCIRCGCGKHTDTWAESVKYVKGEFTEELEQWRG